MFGALLNEARLLYNFYGVYFLVVFGDEFVAPGEAALPKETSLGIPGHGIVFEAIILDYVKIFVRLVGDVLRSV